MLVTDDPSNLPTTLKVKKMKIVRILTSLFVAIGLLAPATAATASTTGGNVEQTASATVLSAPKSIAASSSRLHNLNAGAKGKKTVMICDFWNLPKGQDTHVGCPEGSQVLRLHPGESSRQYGWKDTDGTCATKGYMIQRRTTTGQWRTVVKGTGGKTRCQKISPNLLYGGWTTQLRRVKLPATGGSGGGSW